MHDTRGDGRMEGTIAMIADVGDLVGGWSWTVWLLIPLVLVAAVVTALVVGPSGDPPRRAASAGRGVSSHLARHDRSEVPS